MCQAVRMDANGVLDKLDADICKLDEASKVVMLRQLLLPVRDEQEYASSGSSKIQRRQSS